MEKKSNVLIKTLNKMCNKKVPSSKVKKVKWSLSADILLLFETASNVENVCRSLVKWGESISRLFEKANWQRKKHLVK